MKIFSLETKKHLVGWSVVLGMLLSLSVFAYSPLTHESVEIRGSKAYGSFGFPLQVKRQIVYDNMLNCPPGAICESPRLWPDYGEPRGYTFYYQLNFWLNLLFWFLVSLIILSLIRHFKNRK